MEYILEIIIKNLIYFSKYIKEEKNRFSPFYAENTTDILEIENNSNQCIDHQYKIRIIERKPLIIYIEQFLRYEEIQHLIEITEFSFTRSRTYNEDRSDTTSNHRTSNTAAIKRHQTPVVYCLEQRFAQFQGNISVECIEPLQVVKYTSDQQYKGHYDWFPDEMLSENGGQRVSTFFTYLQSNCSLGETEFPDVKFNKSLHEKFCDILICDKFSSEHGLRFRPIPGNSIFWFNIDEIGQVEYLTFHAGRPPTNNGLKIGLNTWTRKNILRI